MHSKFLLIALSAAVFSSCSSSYKSGQTPDDVYFSPVKYSEDKQNNEREDVKKDTREDYVISMGIRDQRWRDFNDEYSYRNSPYHYCTCSCNNTGYYYNPSYHTWPVYVSTIIPVNTTPRMVNLNAYRGYSKEANAGPKTGTGVNWVKPTESYNNSNRTLTRRIITPANPSSNSSNDTRTYSPSSNNSGSNNSSSGGNNAAPVARPKRGG